MLKNRRIGWLIGAVVGLLIVVGLLTRGGGGVPVRVAQVVRDTLSVTVSEEGRTRSRERFVVGAPISGRLSRTAIEEGDAVSTGQILTTLAPAPQDLRDQTVAQAAVEAAEARVPQAHAAVEEAETAYAQARREVDRRLPLLEQGALSRETVERFEQAAEAAAARVQTARSAGSAAEADVRAARARMLGASATGRVGAAVDVRAPADGIVLRVIEESERVVPAGAPLFEIAAPGGLEIVVDLLTEDAVRVEAGSPMVVTGWGGDHVLRGAVRHVEPAAFTKVSALGVEEQRVNVIGNLAEPARSLGEGYRVEATIVTWRGQDVLVAPAGALFRRGGAWQTFVVEDGRARLRRVEMGHRGLERIEVVSGLDEGDQLVLFPSELVEDGVRVEVTPAP